MATFGAPLQVLAFWAPYVENLIGSFDKVMSYLFFDQLSDF
jgi:hypothetical protein